MTIDVRETLTIDVAQRRVASYVSDPANDPAWIGGIKNVQWLTTPPLQVGSRVQRLAKFMGRSIDYVLEVAALDPDKVVMKSVKAPFPMVVTYSFEDRGDATVAGVRVQGGSGALFKIAGPLMAAQVRRNLRADLRRLKERLER